MTQRDGRTLSCSTASNHVELSAVSDMADDDLITRAEPRNHRRNA
jgi:hypothetical protein